MVGLQLGHMMTYILHVGNMFTLQHASYSWWGVTVSLKVMEVS